MQFRLTTGESWQYMMWDLSQSQSWVFNCTDTPRWDSNPPDGCGDPVSAQGLLLSFTLIVSFIMMNLFVAVILGAAYGPPIRHMHIPMRAR